MNTTTRFIPGLELSRRFYREVASAPTGSIDEISDNTDILENTPRHVTRRLFE